MDRAAVIYHRFLRGDKSALTELVEMYNKNLIFFINSYVANTSVAEDLAADTFCELITSKNSFTPNFTFKTWLFKVAKNNALDYLKRKEHTNISLDDVCYELADKQDLEESVLRDESMRQLHSAMAEMNDDYREILHLLYFEEMTYEEAAEVMRKNSSQIKNLAFRARQSLKNILEKEGFVYAEQ
jgi:RNA polymerase sigma-70 factor (ECF subfamily)